MRWIWLLPLLAVAGLSGLHYHHKHSAKPRMLFSGNYGNSVSGQYLSSRFAALHNDWEDALAAIKPSVTKENVSAGMLDTAMRLELRLGNIEEAKNLAERVAKLAAKDPLAATIIAAYHLKQRHLEKVQQVLQPFVIVKPDAQGADITILVTDMLQIWALAESRDYEKAMAKLDRLIHEGPPVFSQFLHYQAAIIADMAGMKTRADQEYSAIIKSHSPKSYRFMEGAISFYRRSGNPLANQLYEEFMKKYLVLSENSSLPLTTQPIVNDGIEGAAELFAEVGSYLNDNVFSIEAVEYLRLALYLRPDLPHAQYILADILSSMGHEKEAIELLGKINPNSPYNWRGRIGIARDLEKIGTTKQAESILLSLDQERPENLEAIATLGDIYQHQENYAQAAKVYEKAVEKIKNPEEKHWVLFYSLGAAYERIGEWKKAEHYLIEALKLSPGQPEALNYLAYSWVERGENLQQAREMLETALKKSPDDAHIIDSYGWALFRLKDYPGAVKNLEQAAMGMPYDSTVNDHLGDAYWMAGRRNEARFQWSAALNMKPEPSQVVLIKRKLAQGLDQNPEK